MSLSNKSWRTVYVEPSRRPTDGRYGENPNRTQLFFQLQVILKPSPPDIQEVYLNSLREIGIQLERHDVRFVEDDWESPTLGAWGLGWEVWIDGMEITQYTYFQQVGGIELPVIPVELTYGLERLAMFIQGVDSMFDLKWSDTMTYYDVRHKAEVEFSTYNFEEADVDMHRNLFNMYFDECKRLLDREPPLVLPATDYCIKCSHIFNMLEARGAISVAERTAYIGRVRGLARRCAQLFHTQEQNRETAV